MPSLAKDFSVNLAQNMGVNFCEWEFINSLYFANNSPRFAVNPKTGEIKLFAAHIPAIIKIDGENYIQVENTILSKLIYTQDKNQWDNIRAVTTENGYTDPLGGNSAQLIKETTDNLEHGIWRSVGWGTAGTIKRTLSFFIKPYTNSRPWIALGGLSGTLTYLNILTNTLGTVAGGHTNPFHYQLPDRWIWFGFTCNDDSGGLFYQIWSSLTDGGQSTKWVGDTSYGFYLWQHEGQEYPYQTSPVLVNATAVTRYGDISAVYSNLVPNSLKDKAIFKILFKWPSTILTSSDVREICVFEDSSQQIRCYYDGSDKKVKLAGILTALQSISTAFDVFIDNGYLYTTTLGNHKIYRGTITGSQSIIYTANGNPGGIAVNGTKLYIAVTGGTDFGIWQTDLNGTNPVQLTNAVSNPGGVRVIGTKVYWTEQTDGKIKSVDYNTLAVIDELVGETNPFCLASDSTNTYLYFTSYSGGKIRKWPVAGGSASDVKTGLSLPAGISLDNTNIYFSTNGGGLYSIPIAGGSVITLATGLSTARGVKVDGPIVYCAAYGLNEVCSIYKGPFSSSTTSHSELTKALVTLDRVSGSIKLENFTSGNGTTVGTPWNRTDGTFRIGYDINDINKIDGFIRVAIAK
jgi:hypothetical protein